jgi:hypothetical protein
MVLGTMVVLPIVSIVIEGAILGWDTNLLILIGKWFVFWGIGIRLVIAGISQTVRPQFTTENILGAANPGADHIVQELGFANLGFGAAALLSLVFPTWLGAAALAGGLFLLLAGLRHIGKSGKNAKELLATVTDLLVGVIGVVTAVAVIVG